MKLRDAAKLQTGDQVYCGPNSCYCDGGLATIERTIEPCGCTMIYHERNTIAFLCIPRKECKHANGTRPHWMAHNKNSALDIARNIRKGGRT